MVRPELVEWAKQRLAKGFTVGQLRESLEKGGYPAADVDEVLSEVTKVKEKPEPPEEKAREEPKEAPKEEEKPEEPKKEVPEEKPEEEEKPAEEKKEPAKEAPKEEEKPEPPEEKAREEPKKEEEKPELAEKKEKPEPKPEPKHAKKRKKRKRVKHEHVAKGIRTSPLFEREQPQKKEGFMAHHKVGIALILIIIALLAGIAVIYLYTSQRARDAVTPPQESTMVLILADEIRQQREAGVPSTRTIVFTNDDYVLSSDLLEASGGSPVVFCAGYVGIPDGCDDVTWRVEDPCTEEYSFTGLLNQEFFSSDTSQLGIRVIRTISGELRVSQVCGTYFISFKGKA